MVTLSTHFNFFIAYEIIKVKSSMKKYYTDLSNSLLNLKRTYSFWVFYQILKTTMKGMYKNRCK